MHRKRQKIIAMAMALCIDSSSGSDTDDNYSGDNEIVGSRKRPRIYQVATVKIEEIPTTDLNLIKQFCNDLMADHRNFLRLDDSTFGRLLSLVEPFTAKRDAELQQPIGTRERLTLTLSYLSTGRNYDDLIFSSAKTPQSIKRIVLETCDDIYKCLRNDFMKVPSTEAEWKQIANNFELKWQFNKCLGAVGGKHIMFARKSPQTNGGSHNYAPHSTQNGNADSYSNAILMAIVNDNFEFVYVNVSVNSRPNDSGIWESSDFNSKLLSNSLKIPTDYNVRGSKSKLPYVFIGDKSFPLRNNLLRPFAIRHLQHEEKIFNYRLVRARRVIENAFAMLTSRFQCFHRPIAIDSAAGKVDSILLAACTLHNFLLRTVSDYVDLSVLDYEDTDNGGIVRGTRQEAGALLDLSLTTTSTTNNGKIVRNEFKKFFSSSGKVSFQDRMIERIH